MQKIKVGGSCVEIQLF